MFDVVDMAVEKETKIRRWKSSGGGGKGEIGKKYFDSVFLYKIYIMLLIQKFNFDFIDLNFVLNFKLFIE